MLQPDALVLLCSMKIIHACGGMNDFVWCILEHWLVLGLCAASIIQAPSTEITTFTEMLLATSDQSQLWIKQCNGIEQNLMKLCWPCVVSSDGVSTPDPAVSLGCRL